MIVVEVEPRPEAVHSASVLAKLLADAIREHCARTGETELQLAIRIDMPHQNLYDFIRRAEDPGFDVGRKKLERLAAAIGMKWKLEPAAPAERT